MMHLDRHARRLERYDPHRTMRSFHPVAGDAHSLSDDTVTAAPAQRRRTDRTRGGLNRST
jgi:hypothetical protein